MSVVSLQFLILPSSNLTPNSQPVFFYRSICCFPLKYLPPFKPHNQTQTHTTINRKKEIRKHVLWRNHHSSLSLLGPYIPGHRARHPSRLSELPNYPPPSLNPLLASPPSYPHRAVLGCTSWTPTDRHWSPPGPAGWIQYGRHLGAID